MRKDGICGSEPADLDGFVHKSMIVVVADCGECCSQEHLIFGNKAYNRPSSHDRPLSGGKVLQSGFEKNVRFVGNSPESAVIVAQIDG